jgi:hypothetical protein
MPPRRGRPRNLYADRLDERHVDETTDSVALRRGEPHGSVGVVVAQHVDPEAPRLAEHGQGPRPRLVLVCLNTVSEIEQNVVTVNQAGPCSPAAVTIATPAGQRRSDARCPATEQRAELVGPDRGCRLGGGRRQVGGLRGGCCERERVRHVSSCASSRWRDGSPIDKSSRR